MRITHVCLSAFYCEGYTYQENLLSLYHKKMGYEVDIIASLQSFDENGKPCLLEGSEDYINEHGIHVVRLGYAHPEKLGRLLRKHVGFKEILNRLAPDILFVHGVQSAENAVIARYMEAHPYVKLYMDNHADYSNSATNWLSRRVLHRVVWRHYAQLVEPYVERFWGVLPARVDFLVENYGLPLEKCDLLVMGADDDEVARASDPAVRVGVRSRLGFSDDDFVVVTGGKIDPAKTQTFMLMDAVLSMGADVRLLVFGPVDPALRPEFDARLGEGRIVHVPWADASESYDYFAAADVICFPGRHSVYWEQAVAMARPLVVKRWAGTDHVDVCGNVAFLESDDPHEIMEKIADVRSRLESDNGFPEKICEAARHFMYSDIAERAIGLGA